jgi:hypothetical protein
VTEDGVYSAFLKGLWGWQNEKEKIKLCLSIL